MGEQVIDLLHDERIKCRLLREFQRLDAVALRDGHEVRMHAAREDARVNLACLHHHGEIGQLVGTLVDVETVEIVLEDELRNLTARIARLRIDLREHGKGIDENMAAAHAGVDEADILGTHALRGLADGGELPRDRRLLLRLGQIVAPAERLRAALGMPLQPVAAETVLHHVAHNPVRRKELRRGGDILFPHLFLGREDGILRLRIVVLVEPADNLHGVAPVLLGDIGHEMRKHAFPAQQVVGQQQLRPVCEGLEHRGQHLAQRVALRDKQVFIERRRLVILLHGEDARLIQPRLVHGEARVQYLRLERALLIREDAHMRGQIAVDLHEAQRREAVKPRVGGLLHHGLEAMRLHLAYQPLALALLHGLQHAPLDSREPRLRRIFLHLIAPRPLRHALDELPPRPNGIFLNGVLIHAGLSFSFVLRPISRSQLRRTLSAPLSCCFSVSPMRRR